MTARGLSAGVVTGFAPRMGNAGSRTAASGPDRAPGFADVLRDVAAPGPRAAQSASPQLAERRTAGPENAARDLGPSAKDEDAGAAPDDGAMALDVGTSTGAEEGAVEVLSGQSPALPGLPGSAALAAGAAPMLPAGPPAPAPLDAPGTAPGDTIAVAVLPARSAAGQPSAPFDVAGMAPDAVSAGSATTPAASRGSAFAPRAAATGAIAGDASRASAMPAASSLPAEAAQIDVPARVTVPGPGGAAHISERATASGGVVVLGRQAYIAQLRAPASSPMPAQPQAPAADTLTARAAVAPPREREPAGSGGGSSEDGAGPHPGPAGTEDAAVSATATESARATGTLSPTQQVAGRIVAAALAAQPEHLPAGTAPAIAGAVPWVASTPVVRVLRLQLQPADLGTITIRLSLREDALDIRLEASRNGTAGMLQRDQETLARLLSSAGYRLEGMAVTVTAADGTQLADGRAAVTQTATAPDSWGSSYTDARSSGGRHNAPADPGPSRGKQHEDDDKSGARRSAVGGLYV